MLIVTHNGEFHADDVFAVAVLTKIYSGAVVIRTRDAEEIARADIVIDVGGIYHAESRRFDHHQREGAGERENSVPYSSIGLVWKHYGDQVVEDRAVRDEVDRALIQEIDAHDNGLTIAKATVSVPQFSAGEMIALMGPTYEEQGDTDAYFVEAVRFADSILERSISHATARVHACDEVTRALAARTDERILILDAPYPWHETVALYPEVFIVVQPAPAGVETWYAYCVRKDPQAFETKISYPAAWAGLRGDALAEASGVADALFCHRTLYLAVARSKEGVRELAKLALSQ